MSKYRLTCSSPTCESVTFARTARGASRPFVLQQIQHTTDAIGRCRCVQLHSRKPCRHQRVAVWHFRTGDQFIMGIGIQKAFDASHDRSKHAASGALRCRRKFLRVFRDGFRDETYLDWERNYKWQAHGQWEAQLDRAQLRSLVRKNEFAEVAARAVRIESRTNLLFSFEKMALRDAVRAPAGARAFATGLDEFLLGRCYLARLFERWCEIIVSLPRKQTRVLTWPLVTVFGFL